MLDLKYRTKFTFAALPRTQRGQPLVLGSDPKGSNFLYANGNSVVIRNIENPEYADIYTEHSCVVNVAKYSPSGFYIASGDISGKIRIWDTVNKEHILKNEFQPICGPIKDIAWSPDSQRIVVVGEGRERFGHVIMAETGTSVGEISGQSKAINSCDFRPTRPFRIITGSEDNTIAIFEGPPFKFKMTKQEHTRFVQAVRYSPDGRYFASAGFDGKIFLYNGLTSELVCEIGDPAHKGGVYAVAWKPDGSQLLSCSGDKTCRLWDLDSKKLLTEFEMGNSLEDQQVSCLWQKDFLLSVSLCGNINYLDLNNPSKPLRIIKGHNKPITALGLGDDCNIIYTASHDGIITSWNSESGVNDRVLGNGHGNQINGIDSSADFLYTIGIDDTIRKICLKSNAFTDYKVKLTSQPKGLTIFRDVELIVVVCLKEISLIKDETVILTITIPYEANCVSSNAETLEIAVGGNDQKLHIYKVNDQKLDLQIELDHLGVVTDCCYSPNHKYLAACDSHRRVVLYSVGEYKLSHNKEWGFHNARINTISWSPNSLFVASGSLDTNIIIWSVVVPNKHLIIKNAHPQSQITRLAWLDNNTLVSTGQDCNTKLWEIDDISSAKII